jgi:pre-rRNA-processing protein TSR1
MIEDEDYDISYDENDEKETYDENGNRISKKHLSKINVKYRTHEEMEFPDEVDTPIDMSARERFKRYK